MKKIILHGAVGVSVVVAFVLIIGGAGGYLNVGEKILALKQGDGSAEGAGLSSLGTTEGGDGKRQPKEAALGQGGDFYSDWSPKEKEPGFEVQSVITADMPEMARDELKNDIENLRKTGSFSGGKLTHEFSKAVSARKELAKVGGIDGFVKNLSYKPINYGQALGPGFNLVGVDYAGPLVEGKGFGAGYYLYEAGVGKVEISEMSLGGDGGANITIVAETVNQYIGGKPATLEVLVGAGGERIFNVHWNANSRSYSMSTMNLEKEAAIQLAERISQLADAMDGKQQ